MSPAPLKEVIQHFEHSENMHGKIFDFYTLLHVRVFSIILQSGKATVVLMIMQTFSHHPCKLTNELLDPPCVSIRRGENPVTMVIAQHQAQ